MQVRLGREPHQDHRRDAIHVPVYATVAAEQLYPGQHVGVGPDGASPKVCHVGVVDPFLAHCVPEGARVWVLLFPRGAHNLRHEWSHPLLDKLEAAKPAVSADFKADMSVEAPERRTPRYAQLSPRSVAPLDEPLEDPPAELVDDDEDDDEAECRDLGCRG